MLRIKVRKTAKDWFIILLLYLLVFQNALETVMPVFSYMDELLALLGIATVAYQGVQKGKVKIKRSTFRVLMIFLVFLAAGIAGNLRYHYQPMAAVLTDLYTNMKFFLTIISGWVLLQNCDFRREGEMVVAHVKLMVFFLFVLLLMDLAFQIFPAKDERYGLRAVQLMYFHPTYLAGSATFLLAALTLFYQKRNNPYIAMSLILLFCTLRGKAVAGTVIYCLIFYFMIVYRKKLKLWHIVVIVLAAIAVAGEQFIYYYIDLEGKSARSALTQASFIIIKDYFPIGTGFGTFASASAVEYYSPVYTKYGLSNIYGLTASNPMFSSDTFWPIIIGQTGAIGTLCYLVVLLALFLRILKIRKVSIPAYATGIFIFIYLMISSTSEPAFNNSIASPLALLLGYILTLEEGSQKKL